MELPRDIRAKAGLRVALPPLAPRRSTFACSKSWRPLSTEWQ